MVSGWREGLTLERIDVNGNYTPDNCKFITRKDQARNRRSNRYITAFGETKPAFEWETDERCKVKSSNIWERIDRLGWDAETAISTPAGQPRK